MSVATFFPISSSLFQVGSAFDPFFLSSASFRLSYETFNWLRERGYKHKLVEDQIKRACDFDRDDLLTQGKPPKKNVLSLNIEYNPAFSKLSNVLKELNCILQGDEQHKKVFSDIPLVGFSNGKSLKNILVRAVLPSKESTKEEGGVKEMWQT